MTQEGWSSFETKVGKAKDGARTEAVLHGYREIFKLMLSLDKLHNKDFTVNEVTMVKEEGKQIIHKMRLSGITDSTRHSCECEKEFCKNYLDAVFGSKTEGQIIHLYKTYLQGHMRSKTMGKCTNTMIEKLQEMCIEKNFPQLACITFETHMSQERLWTLFKEKFDELTDDLTAVFISEMDGETFRRNLCPKSEEVNETTNSTSIELNDIDISEHVSMKWRHRTIDTIMNGRHKSLPRVLDKLLQHRVNDEVLNCGMLEMDGQGNEPDTEGYDTTFLTVFQKIAYEELEDAVCHRALLKLVETKWEKWCRFAFTIDACIYLTSFIFLTFTVICGVTASDVKTYNSPLDVIRAIFEIVLLINAIRVLVTEVCQVTKLRTRYFVDKTNILEIMAPALLLLVLPMRYIHEQAHWFIFAAGYLVWLLQVIKYAPVFKSTGVYAEALQKMIMEDFLKFGILISITTVIFSGTFLLVLKGENSLKVHDETSTFWGILLVGLRIMIEAGSIVEYAGDDGYNPTGTFVKMLFMFFTVVVLLNILIAQLINTYQKIESSSLKGFYVRRAKIVARMEREQIQIPCFPCTDVKQRKNCYSPTIQMDGKFADTNDSAILNDDPWTVLQDVEHSLRRISRVVEDTKTGTEETIAELKCSMDNKLSQIRSQIQTLQVEFDFKINKILENSQC